MVLWVVCYFGGILGFVFITLRGWVPDNQATVITGILVSMSLGFVVMFLHHWLFTARWGRTAGKFLTGIRVVDVATGRPPTVWNAAKRTLVRLAVQLVPFGQVANALIALQDPRSIRTWHDKAAGTWVIRA
ncbi:RDD family protein [Actinorugispora endophytica]|uniref:RDD family protein n=2 Tax=Actinorugispora endophytica TaxID=1605990 RepID=A0A4R6V2W9_9ACTN|nr:RDD family protein [Actinorugispora endophytica]